MKRLFFVSICSLSLLLGAAAAHAQANHASGGIGFHSSGAPLGVRWWLAGQKVGLDAGLGFSSRPSAISPDDKETGFAFDVGVPFVMKSWEGVHLLFRPGLVYTSQQIGFDSDGATPGIQFDTQTETTLGISAELEAEVFLRDNFSVSASSGVLFSSFNPAGPGDSITNLTTIGNNFTEVGFHLYFLGEK